MTPTDEMRRLIALLENNRDDDEDEPGISDLVANRGAIERLHRERALILDPPVVVAKLAAGELYHVPRSMIEDPILINHLGFSESFSDEIRWASRRENNLGAFYLPEVVVVSVAQRSEGPVLVPFILRLNGDQERDLFNAVDRVIRFDHIADHDSHWMRNQKGLWTFWRETLDTENQRIDLPGLKGCWKLSPGWIHRGLRLLSQRKLWRKSLTKGLDQLFLADLGNENLVLVAFGNNRLIGSYGSRTLAQDQIRNVVRLVEPIAGVPANPSMIKANSRFHEILSYIADHPGTSRSGWWNRLLGNAPAGLPLFSGAPDGMAHRLGLITYRDPGASEHTYQLRITPKGAAVLDRLNRGEDQNIDDLVKNIR